MERKIIAVLVLLVAGLSLALVVKKNNRPPVSQSPGGSAAQKQTSDQRYVEIAFATGLPYFLDHKSGLGDKAKELGVEAAFTGPVNNDVNQQIDAVNRAVAQGVDGILIIPVSDALRPAIDKAIRKGIPVVCVDADAPSSGRYSFVGTGNFNAGSLGGGHLGELLQGKGKVAILTAPGITVLKQRVDGYMQAFEKYPGIEVVQTGNTQSSGSESYKIARAILQAIPDLAAFVCVEAAGGQGAAVAVKEAGKIGKVRIVAMDKDQATVRSIQEGVIDASVAQRSYTMSYLGLQMLYNLRNEQIRFLDDWRKAGVNPLPPNVDTGSFLITKENAKFFIH